MSFPTANINTLEWFGVKEWCEIMRCKCILIFPQKYQAYKELIMIKNPTILNIYQFRHIFYHNYVDKVRFCNAIFSSSSLISGFFKDPINASWWKFTYFFALWYKMIIPIKQLSIILIVAYGDAYGEMSIWFICHTLQCSCIYVSRGNRDMNADGRDK